MGKVEHFGPLSLCWADTLPLDEHWDEYVEVKGTQNFAINEFRDMKMQPSLERALKHKEILGA